MPVARARDPRRARDGSLAIRIEPEPRGKIVERPPAAHRKRERRPLRDVQQAGDHAAGRLGEVDSEVEPLRAVGIFGRGLQTPGLRIDAVHVEPAGKLGGRQRRGAVEPEGRGLAEQGLAEHELADLQPADSDRDRQVRRARPRGFLVRGVGPARGAQHSDLLGADRVCIEPPGDQRRRAPLQPDATDAEPDPVAVRDLDHAEADVGGKSARDAADAHLLVWSGGDPFGRAREQRAAVRVRGHETGEQGARDAEAGGREYPAPPQHQNSCPMPI